MSNRPVQGFAALTAALLLATGPTSVSAADSGGIVGWVEDGRGTPVSGAVISLFGSGLGRTGLVTLSDSTGRFMLPSLPAGSYTLRAISDGLAPSLVRGVTVLPDRDATYTLSLSESIATALRAKAETNLDDAEDSDREWRWLLRHKKRSVLESRDARVMQASDRIHGLESPALEASLEVVATPWLGDEGQSSSSAGMGVVHLAGHFSDSGEWAVRGLLSESQETAWRMAGEFSIDPGGEHQLRAGTGYGSLRLRPRWAEEPEDVNGFGAAFVEDVWHFDPNWALTGGARVSYLGFLQQSTHVDPHAELAWGPNKRTRFSVRTVRRTLGPGGDLLAVDSLSSAPSMSFALMTPDVRAERTSRYEAAAERAMGGVRVRAHTFYEDVRDQLVSVYEPSSLGTLRISNGGDFGARGVGVSVARGVGGAVNASLAYTYGRAWRTGEWPVIRGGDLDGTFHDIAGRVEASYDPTGTRLIAYYRLNLLRNQGRAALAQGSTTSKTSRFDVQVTQELPFLQPLTRAEWEFLVAVRNLFYGPGEAALLDELVVSNPPTRILGGFAIRF